MDSGNGDQRADSFLHQSPEKVPAASLSCFSDPKHLPWRSRSLGLKDSQPFGLRTPAVPYRSTSYSTLPKARNSSSENDRAFETAKKNRIPWRPLSFSASIRRRAHRSPLPTIVRRSSSSEDPASRNSKDRRSAATVAPPTFGSCDIFGRWASAHVPHSTPGFAVSGPLDSDYQTRSEADSGACQIPSDDMAAGFHRLSGDARRYPSSTFVRGENRPPMNNILCRNGPQCRKYQEGDSASSWG